MGLLAPLLISGATGLISKAFAGKVKGPVDTTDIERSYWDRGRTNLGAELDRQWDNLRAAEAQKGMTSSAATSQRQDLFRTGSSTMADFDADMASALSRAKADYKQRDRDFENQQVTNRANMIAGVGGAVSNYYMTKDLLGQGSGKTDGDRIRGVVDRVKGWFKKGPDFTRGGIDLGLGSGKSTTGYL